MRIAHFIDTPRRGGAERVLQDVVAGCVSAGHETTLLSPQPWLLDEIAAAVPGLATVVCGNDAYASTAGPAAPAWALAAACRAARGAAAPAARRPARAQWRLSGL